MPKPFYIEFGKKKLDDPDLSYLLESIHIDVVRIRHRNSIYDMNG